MELSAIIKNIKTRSVTGSLNREITGIAYDSRQVTPGMLFVALKGQNVDGHDFVMDAIDRGASAIICERNGIIIPQKVTKIVVEDARECLATLSAAFYNYPSKKLKVIGITGTNGKTTVAFMIKEILESAGYKCGLIGTIRYEIGERVIPAWRTTPESLDLQDMLDKMVRNGCTACVMEVSSHALDQKRVLGVEFDSVVFTNLTQDHLDYHKDMESYYNAKKKLFRSEQSPSKNPYSVINIDDFYGKRLLAESDLAIKCTYGINEEAMIRATDIVMNQNGAEFTVNTPSEKFNCRISLIGRHNIYNALAATGAAIAFNVSSKNIKKALEKMNPVPGRLEKINLGQPFTVIVDYAHTDDALRNVLTSLRELTKGRLLLTFGCGGSRDTTKRAKMGKVAAELADYTIITTDNPRKEDPQKIADQIKEGYVSVRQDSYKIELDRKRAIQDIISMAKSGDTVLIAGKGHETYQEFMDTVVPFDDRVYARQKLEDLGYSERKWSGIKLL
jgi:UDP-N-acetylmuramoyl-L-alanyl-D-glutamate--2,6-diaminopimelate ligase